MLNASGFRTSAAPKALVIRAAGTNCDAEMARGFEQAGAEVTRLHVDRLVAEPEQVERFDLIGFPGGFSYGDDVASGRILAVKLRERLYPQLRAAASRGVCMIGACNGFQVLVQVGLLPDPRHAEPVQTAALSHNEGGRFIDRWVGVRANPDSPCVWTRPLAEWASQRADAEETLMLPIAHGEGRFVVRDASAMAEINGWGGVALRYTENPNGSTDSIAGICDPSGRIFGLMPHPERYLEWTTHPFWTRLSPATRRGETPGALLFRSAVQAAMEARV